MTSGALLYFIQIFDKDTGFRAFSLPGGREGRFNYSSVVGSLVGGSTMRSCRTMGGDGLFNLKIPATESGMQIFLGSATGMANATYVAFPSAGASTD